MILELTIDNVDKLRKEENTCLIYFYNDMCSFCSGMGVILQNLSDLYPNFNIYKVDTNALPEVAGTFHIRGVPSFILFERGNALIQHSGAISLHDLKFLVDNKDDSYMREFGEFKQKEANNRPFYILIIVSIIILIVALIFI